MNTSISSKATASLGRCPLCDREYPAEHQFCMQDGATLLPAEDRTAEMPSLSALPIPCPQPGLFSSTGRIAGAVGLACAALIVLWFALGPKRTASRSSFDGSTSSAPVLPSGTASQLSAQTTEATGVPNESDPGEIPSAVPPRVESWKTYRDAELGFAIDYPAAWKVKRERHTGRIRVQFDATADVYVGVDVSPAHYVSLDEWQASHPGKGVWEDLEAGYVRGYGDRYRRLDIGEAHLGGQASGSWLFTAQPKGKEANERWDTGTYYHAHGYAVLCAAPAAQFEALRPTFQHMLQSFRFL